MEIKGISAERAEETYHWIASVQAEVAARGQVVLDDVERRNRETVTAEWKARAQERGDASIDALVDVLWNQMCLPDGLEFERADDPATGTVQMHCTYCPWHAVAAAAGAAGPGGVGYALFCATDPHMVAGFNEAAGPGARRIAFSRTTTLMQGGTHCDHRYAYADDGAADAGAAVGR
ncbi:L-2-amino-thiazoline-4-carboxylic acid hydrolase [Actinotalea fermentans]|uniref:L-2-amino-thiazoline-4-carboxylic acid hydrolase n=1 Tax=Actinotalea fermentans TaxID=43671 RepID=A0A511Z0M3_9CELL|nr:L-2-amino-thiazoline-4-carboxylic acid hydrolase [Actinotalea fermentans]KGM15764.1 hypothetical protein N867_05850 [Actinotalea fermentans ATCC 43279 = JCM 9966 = DSM 3133]GEN81000.1 hypothetical protein AFE02nite_27340 [Actinotalea fermentans]